MYTNRITLFFVLLLGSGCGVSGVPNLGGAPEQTSAPATATVEASPTATLREVAPEKSTKGKDCGGGYWVSAGLSRSGELVVYDTSDGRIPQKVSAGGVSRTMQQCGVGEGSTCRKAEQAGIGLGEPFRLFINDEWKNFEGFRSHVRQQLCGK